MTSPLLRMACAIGLTLGTAQAATAQVSTNRVAADAAWSVFVEENPKKCWGVSAPKETLNTKDGQPVSVRRGDILLFVTYQPGKPAEVSFTGGYPFEDGSTVTVDIGGTKFELGTDASSPEWAWSTPEVDGKIITALKAGASAVLTAHSARGTQTQDTFSLLGISAALGEAEKRCAG